MPRATRRPAVTGALMAPAHTAAQMQQIVLNDHVDVSLTILFMAVVVTMLICGVRSALAANADPRVTARETHHDMPLLQQNA